MKSFFWSQKLPPLLNGRSLHGKDADLLNSTNFALCLICWWLDLGNCIIHITVIFISAFSKHLKNRKKNPVQIENKAKIVLAVHLKPHSVLLLRGDKGRCRWCFSLKHQLFGMLTNVTKWMVAPVSMSYCPCCKAIIPTLNNKIKYCVRPWLNSNR